MTSPLDLKTAFGGVLSDAATFNKKVRLVWIGIGTKNRSGCIRASRRFTKRSRKQASNTSITNRRAQTTNGRPWRRSLAEFAPRLFNS